MRRFSPVWLLIVGAIILCLASTAPARSVGRTTFSVSSFGAVGDGFADDSEIDGDMLAPPGMDYWPKARSPLQWLNFKWLNGFTIQGTGTVDGQSISLKNHSPANVSQHWYVSGVKPTNINCNPGHGISLGGLGKDNSLAESLRVSPTGP
ncbi:hypothetical protein E2562_027649 [Oryza meyeriana var. granulata]|uniref:Ricin B lectin domain-containing protein n=1 Tax=Oryza meyeriana var. granulata TaxID=110450 RepID=A0A6G1E4Z8_9ORYZ|nr:hypothetical protein E2562_027649 [Oryza meyeriana var. granulata]